MTVPNMITLTRIAMIPLFMFAMGMEWRVAALILFVLASVTDSLDGYLARKMEQITNFGKLIDPLADKLLVLAAILYFVAEGTMAAWVAVLVLAREFIVSTLRMVAASSGVVIAAGFSGKVKTVVQMICIIAILSPWYAVQIVGSVQVCTAASWIIAAVALWSGADYLFRHRKLLRENM